MRTAPTYAPSEPPHDVLHAVALVTGAPIACLSWPEGRCLWATAAYAQLLGMPTQELQDKLLQNYLSPCDWNSWLCELERLASAQQSGTSLQTPLTFAHQQRIQTQLIAQTHQHKVCAIVVVPLHNL